MQNTYSDFFDYYLSQVAHLESGQATNEIRGDLVSACQSAGVSMKSVEDAFVAGESLALARLTGQE